MSPGNIVIPLITIVVASLGSWFTSQGMEWYQTLTLPTWTPSGEIIGAVWTLIFILTTISAMIIYNTVKHNDKEFWEVMIWYFWNASFNLLWSFFFFFMQMIGVALVDAILLELSVLILMYHAWQRSRLAAYLLVPYAVWVLFATYLNFVIWRMN